MPKVEKIVENLAEPICEANGCYVYDVQFKKEGSDYVLRLFIDTDEGVGIDTCEAVSRALSDALDEADPISQAYMLEVSSPGVERVLSRDWHFKKVIGKEIVVKLFRAMDGKKEILGILKSADGGILTLEDENGNKIVLEKGKCALCHLAFHM